MHIELPKIPVNDTVFSTLEGETMHHMPDTNDDIIAQWLKIKRDQWLENTDEYWALDNVLNEYRLHADTGQPLYVTVNEGEYED